MKVENVTRNEGQQPAMPDTGRSLEIIEPVGLRVLVRKDEERRTTRGGIHLPDEAKIPVITGRIVALSAQVENDPFRKGQPAVRRPGGRHRRRLSPPRSPGRRTARGGRGPGVLTLPSLRAGSSKRAAVRF